MSSWQHPRNAPINWATVSEAGVDWAYAKCSDGAGAGAYNRWGPTDVTAALAVGITAGCYHFAQPGYLYPTNLDADAIAQANQALAASPAAGTGQLPQALDMEAARGLTPVQLTRWAATFLTHVKVRTGSNGWLYSSSSFLFDKLSADTSLAGYPVWVAAYSTHPTTPPRVPTWAAGHAIAWQFSDSGKVPGIAATTDLNIALGPIVGTLAPPHVTPAATTQPMTPVVVTDPCPQRPDAGALSLRPLGISSPLALSPFCALLSTLPAAAPPAA